MKAKFSIGWRSSTQPRKQRKFIAEAPLHIRKSLLSVHLSKELKEQYGKRSVVVKKGDKVKVLRGNQRGKEGKVEEVSYKGYSIKVTSISYTKKDGSNALYPLDPSNCMITELDVSDPKRKKVLERK